jgi:hypothetical protein
MYCILSLLRSWPFIIEPHEEFEDTTFEMAFQGFGYLIMMMIIANFPYTLGWIIDISFNPSGNQPFREQLFCLGYWFSFSLPILLILSVMGRFLICGK